MSPIKKTGSEIELKNNSETKGEVGEEKTASSLEVDDILLEIGQYGLSQKLLVGIFCMLMIPSTYQSLIMTFIGNSPTWRCAINSTQCNITGEVFDKTHDFYEKRCKMERSSWEYTKDQTFSIVTEVKKINR